MKNTNFEDCCGLTDSANHYTTAEDIAIMSRELITKYPKILEVFVNLDGEYYACDQAGEQGVWADEYE